MFIIKLAWKNLWRNRSRTLITVAAIFFAVILSTVAESLKQGVFENLVKNVVSFYTGYLQVHKSGYQDEQILDNSMQMSPEVERKISLDKNINVITPRLESFALVSSNENTRGCMVTGIAPETEHKITALKEKLVAGNYLEENERSVLVASGLAEQLNVKVNDTIYLIGQGYHGATAAGKYLISGIVKFGSPQLNERVLFMNITTAQDLFSADGLITSYIISITSDQQLDETARNTRQAISKDYEVMTWEELMPEIKQHITADSNNMKIVQGVLYLLIAFGIFSTLLMMMLERKYEMGMMVAIGMKKSKMILLLVTESVMTVLIGCVAGIIASVPFILYFNRHPIRIGGEMAKAYERFGFEAIFPTSTDPAILIYQTIVVMIIGLALSLYPVLKVIRLRPVPAMRM